MNVSLLTFYCYMLSFLGTESALAVLPLPIQSYDLNDQPQMFRLLRETSVDQKLP